METVTHPKITTELLDDQTTRLPLISQTGGETDLLKKASSTSVQSTESLENKSSSGGSDDDRSTTPSNKDLPTFTNEVIVIRPEYFYENTDCQQDNKFMKQSPM